MDKQAAFEKAQNYIKEHGVPMCIHLSDGKEHEEGYAFFFLVLGYKIIVSIQKEAVIYILRQIGERWYPHHFHNTMSRAEALNIVQNYIENTGSSDKVNPNGGVFYENGLDYHDVYEPVWIVGADTGSHLEGCTMRDYFVSMREAKVIKMIQM